ncbi:MAG: hypothetical protein KBF37_12380 [Saprospiraceae bacterium]|nr:hypothetical protein [Saprospiraceae bacterium]MBP9211104.1 hypothetical protein [Saprospiraceae bacterium]
MHIKLGKKHSTLNCIHNQHGIMFGIGSILNIEGKICNCQSGINPFNDSLAIENDFGVIGTDMYEAMNYFSS